MPRRISKVALIAALVAAVSLASSPVVHAITYGELDGNAHPYVGFLLVFADVKALDGTPVASNVPVWRCSGTQLTSTVFLTAGHCVFRDVFDVDADGDLDVVTPVRGWIFFGSTVRRPVLRQVPDARGRVVPHPQYAAFAGFPNTHDLGVVILDQPVSLPRYGRLAALGTLDTWRTQSRAGRSLEAVGYGLQLSRPKQTVADLVRYRATEQFAELDSALSGGFNIHTVDTPRTLPASLYDTDVAPRAGGTCFGDSGGPQLLPGTDVVVGVTSFGLNNNCAGAGFHYRTDIPDARSFLDLYVR